MNRLKEIREERGLIQKDVAEAIGCSVPVYSRYETESREPPLDVIAALAKFFRLPVGYLMGIDDVQKESPVPAHGADLINLGYYDLSPEHRKAVNDLIDSLASVDRKDTSKP